MSSRRAHDRQAWILPLSILLAAGTVHGLLLTQTPAIGFDEGVYVARALDFAETGRLYSSGFWDHPFLGWAFLGSAFRVLDFPAIVVGGGTDQSSFLDLWVVPRALMVLLALVSAVLVYRIALILAASQRQAIFAMAIFALASLSAYYRMVFIDNIGNTLLLAAVLAALEARLRAQSYPFLVVSGALFGLALLTKLSFIAFLPLFVVLFVWRVPSKSGAARPARAVAASLSIWLALVLGIASLWLAFAASVGSLDALIATQEWQLGRSGGWPFWFLMGFLVFRDPFLAILGFAGVVRTTRRGERILLTWVLSYLVFLAIIAVRFDHYLIPVGAPLAIGAAVFLDERVVPWFRAIGARTKSFGDLRLPRGTAVAAALALVVLSTLAYQVSTIPVSAPAQAQAYDAVVHLAPAGGYVIASPAYLWVLQQSRPDLRAVSWFDVPPGSPAGDIVLVVDEHLRSDLPNLPVIADLYRRSNRVAGFGDGLSFVEVRFVA